MNPLPRGHVFHNSSKGLQKHHKYSISFSLICVGIEKKIFKLGQFLAVLVPLKRQGCSMAIHFSYHIDSYSRYGKNWSSL